MALVHRHLAGAGGWGGPPAAPQMGRGGACTKPRGQAGKRRVAIMAQRQGVSGRSDGGAGGIRVETPRLTGKEAGPGSWLRPQGTAG